MGLWDQYASPQGLAMSTYFRFLFRMTRNLIMTWGYVKLIALIWFGIIIIIIIYSWISPKAYRCLVRHVSFCRSKHPAFVEPFDRSQAVRIELQESAHSVRRAEESIPFVGEHGMMLLATVPGLGVWAWSGNPWQLDMRIGTNCVSRVVRITVYDCICIRHFHYVVPDRELHDASWSGCRTCASPFYVCTIQAFREWGFAIVQNVGKFNSWLEDTERDSQMNLSQHHLASQYPVMAKRKSLTLNHLPWRNKSGHIDVAQGGWGSGNPANWPNLSILHLTLFHVSEIALKHRSWNAHHLTT